MTTAVLITGASSGIGLATANRLAARPDLTVYGTVRTEPATLHDAVRVLRMDVTDEASMRSAVSHVEAAHGAVGVLVNNAGYGEYGTVEESDLDRVREQFETNVFGLARMIQLVLPGMRAAQRGRIVNVSSMGGRLVFPFGGYYHASKYAVEALSDALRIEVAPFGIQVALIEPGLIRTGFAATARRTLAGNTPAQGPYATLIDGMAAGMERSYRSRVMSATPDAVAGAIERAIDSRRPRTRYVVTPAAAGMIHTRRLLGGRVWDRVVRAQFG
jgi:NAD(P)-dependent dehydrogenase (short-subunit alcohol dehydrogenase family)